MVRQRPSRRNAMRPFEFVGLALIVGIFTGLVVLMSSRDLTLSLMWLGIAFIVMLVVSATIVLMVRPQMDSADTEGPVESVDKRDKRG